MPDSIATTDTMARPVWRTPARAPLRRDMGSARQAARRSPPPATVPAAKTSDAGSARTRPRG